jgi:DNA-binding CsgD family transcriptional regulator
MKKPLAQKEFNLTPRETDVAKLAATGSSYKKIAAALDLSPRTVDTYLQKVRRKIGAFTAYEVVCILHHYRFR